MSMVRIDTPRGVTLVGSFVRPDAAPQETTPSQDTRFQGTGDGATTGPEAPRTVPAPGTHEALQAEAAAASAQTAASPDGSHGPGEPARREGVVLLAHDFLADRHGEQGRLDLVSASYQKAGLATLSIDFSGLGESDDDVITLANEAEDLRAVSGWLAERGYTRQAIHANGFGATAALLARPEQVRTAVLVGAVVGPQSVLWEQVFSPHQLDELARHGLTRLVDDNPNPRQWNVLSKETLADFSMQEPHTTMAEVPWPVLMIYGALTHEMPDTAADAQKGFPLLKDGSQLVQVRKDHPQEAQAEVARLGTEWVTRHLR